MGTKEISADQKIKNNAFKDAAAPVFTRMFEQWFDDKTIDFNMFIGIMRAVCRKRGAEFVKMNKRPF